MSIKAIVKHSVFLWGISLVLTLAAVVYQRTTGPTYAMKGKVNIGGDVVSFRLYRSHGGPQDHPVRVVAKNKSITGKVTWKRYKTSDSWRELVMERQGDALIARLPHQPPAGKLQYRVCLIDGQKQLALTDKPLVIRFKGDVPLYYLIPHIILMFVGMLLAVRVIFEVPGPGRQIRQLAWATTLCLFLGGITFGAIVQYYAFGQPWTGFPVGHDLTDNKTLVAMIAWALAVWQLNRSKDERWWVLAAALITLAVFLIPHSLMGSELDYSRLPQGK